MPSGIDGSYRKFNCIHCNKEKRYHYGTPNKFCSNSCRGDYTWINETIPRIERGEGVGHGPLKRYMKEKFGDKCSKCNLLPIWDNEELVLQLDHIDGDSDNNFPINLRLLCPNCHSQTSTFGSKGVGNRYKKISKRNKYLQEYKCTMSAAGEAITLTK